MKVPKRVWDLMSVWTCETGNLSVPISRYAKGRTALEIITWETSDISEYLDFEFYDWIPYLTNAGICELIIVRWIGVSHKFRELM